MSKAAELAALIGSQTAQTGRNMAYNGAMNIAQRSTSVTDIGASSGYFTVDRFKLAPNGTAGRLTMTQTADGPSGFANCLKLDCTTADTSIAAAEFLILSQFFEGQDLQRLKKGTSEAESVTLSFYVKGNAAATYTVELYDADNNRSISQRFSVTTSWNRVSLTYVGDTTGALDDDNANSFIVNIWLHAGSDYTSGTQNTVWQTLAGTERANSSDTSFFDSTDRTFFMTGVQLEIGDVATPFEHEDFGTTLRKCQRYYVKDGATYPGGSSAYKFFAAGTCISTTSGRFTYHFPVPMRTSPTLGQSANNTLSVYAAAGAGAFSADAVINSPNDLSTGLTTTLASGQTTGQGANIIANNSTAAFLEFIAEL
jgi:hypothetical protein